jgi:hypothetical protein
VRSGLARGVTTLSVGAVLLLTTAPVGAQSMAPSVVPDTPDAVAVTTRTRSDGRCQNDGGCAVGVVITPVGSEAPPVQGTLDPDADATDPTASMEAILVPGTYSVLVTALALPYGEPAASGEGSTPTPFGGCGTTLELVPGQPTAEIVASMAWEQEGCGIVIEPRASIGLQRPVLADPIVPDGKPPRFRPRGAPDATATTNGIRLDLWLGDTTLEPGQWLLAHARVTNVSNRPIRYLDRFEHQDCPPLRYSADTNGLFGPGLTWTGVAGTYKDRFLSESPLLRTTLRSPTCDRPGIGDVGIGKRLEPGAVLDVPLAGMPAYTLAGQPLPPGTIRVSVAYEHPRSGRPDLVSVAADVTLSGEAVAYPSPGQLADAALATPGFVETLERATDPTDWENGDSWWPKPPYPPQPRLDAARDAPVGIVEITEVVGSDIESPFIVGAVVDPWTGESFGSYWF